MGELSAQVSVSGNQLGISGLSAPQTWPTIRALEKVTLKTQIPEIYILSADSEHQTGAWQL